MARPRKKNTDMDSKAVAFGHRLQKCREAKGLSQGELANKLELSQSYLSHFECGNRNPDTKQLTKICKILKVSSDKLLGLK